MNYFDYIDNLKPDDAFKNSTKAKIKLEIAKQNNKRYTLKKTYLSLAACFIVLFASIFTIRALTKNSEYIVQPTESPARSFLSEKISIHTAADEETPVPQEILIGDNLYIQYQKDDKLEINKSDIGEILYTIDESNLVDGMKTLGDNETKAIKKNKFCNAEVYKLNNYKDNTVVLVKEKDKEEYYLFYLIIEE